VLELRSDGRELENGPHPGPRTQGRTWPCGAHYLQLVDYSRLSSYSNSPPACSYPSPRSCALASCMRPTRPVTRSIAPSSTPSTFLSTAPRTLPTSFLALLIPRRTPSLLGVDELPRALRLREPPKTNGASVGVDGVSRPDDTPLRSAALRGDGVDCSPSATARSRSSSCRAYSLSALERVRSDCICSFQSSPCVVATSRSSASCCASCSVFA